MCNAEAEIISAPGLNRSGYCSYIRAVFIFKASLSESYVVDVCCRDKNRADYIHIHISIKVHLKVVT
jgi:hypothetical protein